MKVREQLKAHWPVGMAYIAMNNKKETLTSKQDGSKEWHWRLSSDFNMHAVASTCLCTHTQSLACTVTHAYIVTHILSHTHTHVCSHIHIFTHTQSHSLASVYKTNIPEPGKYKQFQKSTLHVTRHLRITWGPEASSFSSHPSPSKTIPTVKPKLLRLRDLCNEGLLSLREARERTRS